MSVINEALRAIHIGHVLQPAWNTLEPRESGQNFVSLPRRGHDQASCEQRILNLECPEQREVNFVLGAMHAEHKVLVAKIDKAVQKGAIHRNAGARKKSRAARIRASA